MSQATATAVAKEVESLGEADLLPFQELLDADMVNEALKAEKVRHNDCIYTPIVTLCLFLSQVIDPDHSCRAAVARLIAWRVFRGLPPCSEEDGAYCDARKRMPVAVVRRLVRETARRGEAEAGVEPRDVSFKGALQTLTAFQDALRWADEEERARLWPLLLKAIGGHRVGDRPGRVEPRAIKRRPKPHRLLLVPRPEARKALLAMGLGQIRVPFGRDAMSVVDASLRVHGIGRLRVADGSIMPRVTTGNTQAPCAIIGERAAEMIRADHAL